MADMTNVDQAKAHVLRGRSHLGDERDIDKAFMEFKEALLLDPALDEARDYLARCFFDIGLRYSNNGDNANAIAEYKKGISVAKSLGDLFPKDMLSVMYFNLGAAYSQVGAWKDAHYYFGLAKGLTPNDPDCINAYINAQVKRGRHKEFRSTIPSGAYEYDNRGKQYLQKGDYDKAIADFNDAVILGPKYTDAYENRGEAYIGKGDYDKAIADFTAAINISPKSYDAYKKRGEVYEAKKEHDKAIADFTAAINISPKSCDVYKKRGEACEAKGDHDKAKADFAQVEQLQKKEAARKKRNLIIGWVIAAIIVGLIIKCAVG